MSRIKAVGLLLLAALLLAEPALAASELIPEDMIKDDVVKYSTSTVEYGDYIKTGTTSVSQFYPVVDTVYYEGTNASFIEQLVKNNTYVEVGTPLIKIKVLFDKVTMDEKYFRLECAQTDYIAGCEQQEDNLKELAMNVSMQTDPYEKQLAQLAYKKAQLVYEQYQINTEKSLQEQREDIRELEEDHAVEYITAPVAGVVSNIQYYRVGDTVYTGANICSISSEDVFLLVGSNNNFRYGMDVTIETGNNNNRISMTGHVVAAPDVFEVLGDSRFAVEPHLEDLTSEELEELRWRNTKVYCNYVELNNVLLVSKSALTMTGGKNQLTKLGADGSLQKRFVTIGLTGTKQCFVLQGLEEGETVILD